MYRWECAHVWRWQSHKGAFCMIHEWIVSEGVGEEWGVWHMEELSTHDFEICIATSLTKLRVWVSIAAAGVTLDNNETVWEIRKFKHKNFTQLGNHIMKFPIPLLTNLLCVATLFPVRFLAPFHVRYCASFLVWLRILVICGRKCAPAPKCDRRPR